MDANNWIHYQELLKSLRWSNLDSQLLRLTEYPHNSYNSRAVIPYILLGRILFVNSRSITYIILLQNWEAADGGDYEYRSEQGNYEDKEKAGNIRSYVS